MGESGITGHVHGSGPHANFERMAPNPGKPGKSMVVENRHIYLEWNLQVGMLNEISTAPRRVVTGSDISDGSCDRCSGTPG